MARRIRRRICARGTLLLVGFALLPLLALAPAHAGAPKCHGQIATHVGTGGGDVLRGTSQVDVFLGRGGNDRLVGKGGADLFCGGAGQDVIKGGGGDDVALGQGGDDELDGGPGTDELNGGRGTDECTSGETLANCETPQPEFDVDGSWAGTTSQGKDISFEISDHGITEITIGYAWTGPGCTSDSETTIMFGTAQKIVDNAFDIDGGAGTLDLLIHGEFTSDAAATGTFFAEDTGGFCPGSAEGTWDAAKT